jgi:hypothetical protein
MDRDDLRAALGDLASHVAPLHQDASPAVRERGRQRRRRRSGIITSVTAAALVAILFGGIAIAGHRQTPPDIATGPPPTTVGSSTSRPPTTAEVCTESDLASYGTVPMPTPTRLGATRLYENGMVRLDPPAAGVQAKVPASRAWAGLHGTYAVATYEVVLTSYSAFAPSTGGIPANWHRLMWVVIGRHVPSVPVGGGFRAPGMTTVPPPACYFATELTLFDANTGQELELLTFGG